MTHLLRHRARRYVLMTLCIILLWTHIALASGVVSITPESANAGDQVSATIIMDADASPPIPPSQVQPTAVTIGTISLPFNGPLMARDIICDHSDPVR